MSIHDTYLDNGADIGLTVGEFILSHFDKIINNLQICKNDFIKHIDFSNYIVYDIYTGRNTLYTFDH